MSRLAPCSSCHAHVFVDDRRCPHCGAELRISGAPRVAAVAAGLMLSSCVIVGDPEPEYGVPTTVEPPTTTAATEGATEGDTDGATEGATTSASTGGESGGTDTGASSGGTAADSTSGPEPDYGVATTSG